MPMTSGATVTFLGAAGGTVTGSKHLLEHGGRRLLLDCGLFQGLKALRLRNWARPPLDPRALAAVVLSHAHVDHSGYLPRLVRDGFRGPVYCTGGTADLLEVLLRDAAHLQEEEASFANRHRTSRHDPALPLFTTADAERALTLVERVDWGVRFAPATGVDARFVHAGHILGAAIVAVRDRRTAARLLRRPRTLRRSDHDGSGSGARDRRSARRIHLWGPAASVRRSPRLN